MQQGVNRPAAFLKGVTFGLANHYRTDFNSRTVLISTAGLGKGL